MDKLKLVFAALVRLAMKLKDSDLLEYLGHSSQHSDEFMQGVEQHLNNLKDLDAFAENHRALTQPGGETRTYTKSELDAMVAASVTKAMAEAAATHETTFTRSELDKTIAEAVATALAKQQKKQEEAR